MPVPRPESATASPTAMCSLRWRAYCSIFLLGAATYLSDKFTATKTGRPAGTLACTTFHRGLSSANTQAQTNHTKLPDSYAMRPFEATNKYFQRAADHLGLAESLRTHLITPRRELQVHSPAWYALLC